MIAVQDQPAQESYPPSSGKQRSLHQILGGGMLADVILWRKKNVTVGILIGVLASWIIFEVAGYTLLSLVSNVLLLLISILFVWAKAAEVLNRPPPPIPEMYLTEEMIHEASDFCQFHANKILSAFNDIAQGKDSKLFYSIAMCLLLASTIGRLADILTLSYTIPALYGKYEDGVDRCVKTVHMEVQMYQRVYSESFSNYYIQVKKWILLKKNLLADV
ncbi:reticulon-like protein B12 isoform X2 [Curcuma longa]|uniref:reticulon-like protein B12 isoform X2 n=1 Tax=Curcuma longa TaxID=136217 RepID=UPI003D9EE8DB